MARSLKAELAARKLRLPLLGNDDQTAIREFANLRPDTSLDDFLARNAVPLR